MLSWIAFRRSFVLATSRKGGAGKLPAYREFYACGAFYQA